ncbi:hypothetical protein R1sor_016121 [Riccia sorocarpa]|uniref:Uncharacterized protein n=1 Tax=Riccia sorocarpa TaxID=122646 RepID=A0ABD3HGV1_9MARC
MVDALRAALRLLPAVKPSLGGGGGGPCGACARVPKARLHSPAAEQPALLNFKTQQPIVTYEKTQQERTVIERFARAILKYVGAGLSAVTANQFAGPSFCQAKELGSSVGENHTMAAAEARAVWQRTASNRRLVQEDVIRSPKYAHRPLPHIVSKVQNDVGLPLGHSYYWSNSSWGSLDTRVSSDAKLDLQWQLSPLVTKEYRGEATIGLDESTCTRFCKPAGLQALAAETDASLKTSAGLVGVASEYSAAEIELEWQLIVDSEPKSDFAATMCERRTSEEEDGSAVVIRECLNPKLDQQELAASQESGPKVGSSQMLTKSNKDAVKVACVQEAVVRKEHLGVHKSRARETPGYLETSSSSSAKSSRSWRTADKEALAALVAAKAAERLENCDLPSPQNLSALRTGLPAFDIGPSGKQAGMSSATDKALLASLLRGNEPTPLESVGLPPSPLSCNSSNVRQMGRAELRRVSPSSAMQSSPSTSPSPKHGRTVSTDCGITSWSGSGTSRDSEIVLGEALCHSQTRAREAEKKVEQAVKDRDRLITLFFREASLSLTYRQWVSSLQYENTWLRMYAGDEPVAWLEQSFFNPFTALGRFSRSSWRNFEKEQARRQMVMDHYLFNMWREKDPVWQADTNDIMMGCTLGFAFALGIGLAGAGLMLGWSMGWILLAY